jgi:hypothetical protein
LGAADVAFVHHVCCGELTEQETSEMRRILLALAIMVVALPVRADGPPLRQGVYPVPVGPQGSPSCLMTALQLGYLTGRRELAYSASEACMVFAGSRGAVMPYGYYGPYVPSGWVPPGWALPVPPEYGR